MAHHAQQQALMQAAVQQTISIVESQLDQAIDKFDNLSSGDIEKLRKQRKEQLREKQAMMQEWKRLGHGLYQEIADEKEWFEEAKTNKFLITHFYRTTTEHCKVVDLHLAKIAPRHMETRIVKLNAEKCFYLVDKLPVRVMPTLIMTKDNFVIDRLEGFTELGNTDRFTTEQLEERLGRNGAIEYEGPPPAGAGGERITSNKDNKEGRSVYESARARAIAEIGEQDDFLDSDNEGDKAGAADSAPAASAAGPAQSREEPKFDGTDVKVW